MEMFLRRKILSLFVAFLFMFNFVSISFVFNKETKLASVGVVEQFFSGRAFSSDIVTKMLLQKTQNKTKKTQQDKTKKQDTVKFQECVLPVVLTTSTTNLNKFTILKICDYISNKISSKVEYPLKIPFLRCIFLLLILKMLFNVLPRSISINYNIKNIEMACIV